MHIELAIGVVIIVFLIWWFLAIFDYGRENYFIFVTTSDYFEIGSVVLPFSNPEYKGLIIDKKHAEGLTYYRIKLLKQ